VAEVKDRERKVAVLFSKAQEEIKEVWLSRFSQKDLEKVRKKRMGKLQHVDPWPLNGFKEAVKPFFSQMFHGENTVYHTLAFRQGKDWMHIFKPFLSLSCTHSCNEQKELLLTEPACFSLTHSHCWRKEDNRCRSSGCITDFLAALSKLIFHSLHSQICGNS
jgi:hypothetical protein